jgi:ribonuclease Y
MKILSLITDAASSVVSEWFAAERRRSESRAPQPPPEDTQRARLRELEAQLVEARARTSLLEAERDAAQAAAHTAAAARDAAEAARDALRADALRLQAELDGYHRNAQVFERDAELRARAAARQELDDELRAARTRAETLVADAKKEAAELTQELRTKAQEATQRERELSRVEAQLRDKDGQLVTRERELVGRERAVVDRERALTQLEQDAARLVDERRQAVEAVKRSEHEALERVASLSAEEARARVIDDILEDARRAAAREARQIEDLAREEAEKRAKRVVGIAVQRYAGEYAGERAVTSVPLPNDELKGRIIGREGRNIRAFQEVTGCDLVIDDTPETIVVSSFDPVRREMARLTLERLIQDGRIHPTRIEEYFNKSRDEVERTIKESAEQAILELGIGRLHPDLMRIVGQLRYRYSYAQNILRHSIEVGHMCGLLAQEMGLNPKQAKRAGLLHDIGKAVTHEMEGGHAVIGGQMARKAGEDDLVVNAIAAHHDDEPPRSLLAHLTAAADAISGARPGARREMLESYVRRLEELEKICAGFKGVERSFAIQAGREVRVLVEPGEVDDLGAMNLSREIARKIESELAYPGQIRVTVVRETRAVDYAR